MFINPLAAKKIRELSESRGSMGRGTPKVPFMDWTIKKEKLQDEMTGPFAVNKFISKLT